MKKLAILLIGLNRYSAVAKIGGFLRVPEQKDLLWGGKLYDLDEFNEVAQTVIDKQSNLRLPPGTIVSVRVVDEVEEDEIKTLLGAEYLPEDKDCQGFLSALITSFHPCTSKDWNNMSDTDRQRLIQKFLDSGYELSEVDENPSDSDDEPENAPAPILEEVQAVTDPENVPAHGPEITPETPSVPTEINEEAGQPYTRTHRGRGKYDVLDKSGNIVADNVTKEEAYQLVPTLPTN